MSSVFYENLSRNQKHCKTHKEPNFFLIKKMLRDGCYEWKSWMMDGSSWLSPCRCLETSRRYIYEWNLWKFAEWYSTWEKTNIKCRWHYLMCWDPGLNKQEEKKRKKVRRKVSLSFCFLAVDTVWLALPGFYHHAFSAMVAFISSNYEPKLTFFKLIFSGCLF